MVWYVIAGIAFVVALALLVFNFVRDRRYMGKRTSQAMSRDLWDEIEQERAEALERKERFEKELEEAGKR
jgi:hypothetical protein